MHRIGTTLGAALLLALLAAFALPRPAAAQADLNDKLSFEALTARPSGGYSGGGYSGGYAPRHSYARHGYARHARAAAWHGRGTGRHYAAVRHVRAGGHAARGFAGAHFSRVHYVSHAPAAHRGRRR